MIIRCAGGGTHWGDFLGVPKHLAPLAGEPVLHRAVRLVNDLAPSADVRVVLPDLSDRRYMVPGARRATDRPVPERGDVDKIASSAHLFDPHDRTVILFGDVWWTTADLRSILGDPLEDGWAAWMRFYGDGGEIFGFAFDPEARKAVVEACEVVAEAHRAGRMKGIPGGWGLYRVMHGRDVGEHGDYGHSHRVSRWTDDMDTPKDWHEWCYRWATTPPQDRPDVRRC